MCSSNSLEQLIQEAIHWARACDCDPSYENIRRYEEAFKPIYEYLFPCLVKYLMRRWGLSHEDAEDQAQKILLYVWKHLHKFKGRIETS